ncbi:hypothetical protein IJJ18_02210 [Candidatus Saccharibacteria bacterium]|nr:hypothetical protein [Candidatus Saccharibacteria bacterium]
MKKYMRVIAASLSVVAVIGLLTTLYFVLPGGSTGAEADTVAASGDAATADTEEAVAKAAAKVQEFEDFHTKGRIQTEAIAGWLDKYGVPYKKNANGKIIVDTTRTLGTLFPANDESRTNSAKKAGLSNHAISDAPEYVFDSLTEKDVKKILEAEKKGIGTKVDLSKKKIKALKKEDAQTMIENIIVGLAHTEQISGMFYGDSKTVYQCSSAVKYLIDETDKAWKTKDDAGEIIGINRWLEYDETEKKWYANEDWVANIIAVVNQIVDGCEPEVRVIHADYNWGLKRNDQIQLRRCYLSTEPDNLTAIVYVHRFKDGEIMEQPATNVRDRRPEIPSNPKPPKKTSKPDPNPTPTPGYDPTPGKHEKPDPKPGTKDKPKPTPTIKPKDPDARPTERPRDDKGPGEPEPTPKVPKSDSEEVDESQHQPIADQQTGGTSTPRESIQNDPSATTSPGGQIVTDPHGDGWRIENDRASTDPIETRPSDTGGREGSNNGAISAPD